MWWGREDRNKGQGQKTEREAQMKSEPGGKDLAAPSAVGHGSSWPHLRGLCAKCPGQGVGLGLYPKPSYPGASYHLPVALTSFFSPIYRMKFSPSFGDKQNAPTAPRGIQGSIWPYLAQRNASMGAPRSQVKRKISFCAALEKGEPEASSLVLSGKHQDPVGRTWWVLQAPWIPLAYQS